MSITGPAEGEPIRAGVAIADIASGIFAFGAIMAALFARERSGEGQQIDISLLDSQVALMSYVASNYLISGEKPKRYGNAHPNIVPYEVVQAADGYMAFAAGNDGQWQKFCEAVDKLEWVEDERFASNPGRNQHRNILIPLLNELFRQRSIAEWTALCEQIGLPAAGINDMSEVFQDPQVQARGMRVEFERKEGETIPMVASPLQIPTSPARIHQGPPQLGEHTEEILKENLGYKDQKIEKLRAEGII
jgi:crotonobetainyl-CoA:carnitine CoA-transferase CaiB-like acyl-CoA transferase